MTLLISGVKNIQQAYVSKHMLFRKFFFATLGGTVGAAVLGIWMAFAGYGVWALIAQNLFNQLMDTVILWLSVKWRPKLVFSFPRLKSLFSFGWKILLSSLLANLYNKLTSLIIGKRYTAEELAYYDKGSHFPSVLVDNINSSIDSVLLPTMAEQQDRRTVVKEITRRAITLSTYLIMPLMMGLAVCAEPIVKLVLTQKWLPCVPFLRIFCFTYAFYPIHTANLNALKALGRSDWYLKLEILKKLVGLSAIVVSMRYGVIWMARSCIVTSVLGQLINSYPNRELLDYSYSEQLKDMLPQILLSCVMGGIVYCVRFLKLSDTATLLLQIPLGAAIYIGGSALFHMESYTYILNTAKALFTGSKTA